MEKKGELIIIGMEVGLPLIQLHYGKTGIESADLQAGIFHMGDLFAKEVAHKPREIQGMKLGIFDAFFIEDPEYSIIVSIISQGIKPNKATKDIKKVYDFFIEFYKSDDIINWTGDLKIFQPFIEELKQNFKDFQ